MFKNRKLEVRIVKDDGHTNATTIPEEPTLVASDYALIAEEAAGRLGRKLLVGIVVTIVTTAVIAVLANAVDTALQGSFTNE